MKRQQTSLEATAQSLFGLYVRGNQLDDEPTSQ